MQVKKNRHFFGFVVTFFILEKMKGGGESLAPPPLPFPFFLCVLISFFFLPSSFFLVINLLRQVEKGKNAALQRGFLFIEKRERER